MATAQATKRIPVTLPIGSIYVLNQLVGKKMFGETPAEVAKHLLIAILDNMVERNRLTDVPIGDKETADR